MCATHHENKTNVLSQLIWINLPLPGFLSSSILHVLLSFLMLLPVVFCLLPAHFICFPPSLLLTFICLSFLLSFPILFFFPLFSPLFHAPIPFFHLLRLLTLSAFFCCFQLRLWIRQVLVLTASKWVSGPQQQIQTRSPPCASWTSRSPRSQVIPRLPASSWSGTSQTATGRRSPATSSPWTTKPSLWNRGQVILSQTCSQTVNTGTQTLNNNPH